MMLPFPIRGRFATELFPQGALAFPDAFGNLDVQDDEQVAPSSASLRDAFPTQSEALVVSRAGGDLQIRLPVKQRHRDGGPQHGIPGRNIQVGIQVVLLNPVTGMFRKAETQKQVPGLSIARASFTLAAQAQELSFVNAGGNFHLIGFRALDLLPSATFGTDPFVDLAGPAALVAGNKPTK